jgi:biotin operon repressor
MNPITIIYHLKLRGYTLPKIAKELGTSRQLVWYSIHRNPRRGMTKKIQNKIDEILNNA